jgi:hypothetical protein
MKAVLHRGRSVRIGWRRDILETMAVLHGEQKIAEGPEMEVHGHAEGGKHCTENPIYVIPKKKLCGIS